MTFSLDGIKARLLISDSTYDTELADAIDESCHYVTTQLLVYNLDFTISGLSEDTELFDIINDIGAGTFKRRHMPQDMDQVGWLAQGRKKLAEYITATYKVGIIYFPEDESEE